MARIRKPSPDPVNGFAGMKSGGFAKKKTSV